MIGVQPTADDFPRLITISCGSSRGQPYRGGVGDFGRVLAARSRPNEYGRHRDHGGPQETENGVDHRRHVDEWRLRRGWALGWRAS